MEFSIPVLRHPHQVPKVSQNSLVYNTGTAKEDEIYGRADLRDFLCCG